MLELLPLQTAGYFWWAVGWVLSVTMLLAGFAISLKYYTVDETPPDVDPSQKKGASQ